MNSELLSIRPSQSSSSFFDGHQFYATGGSIANLQTSIFGGDFNVVGIVGRGFNEAFTRAALDSGGHPDCVKAWQIFNSGQWLEDIESVAP